MIPMFVTDLLKIGEYLLDKLTFTLSHAQQRCDSTGRKRRIEYACDVCTSVYVTKLRDELTKEFPWLCRSCRTKLHWQNDAYRKAVMSGITDDLRNFRQQQRSISSKKMWADVQKRIQLCEKLRLRDPIVYSKARRAMRRTVIRNHWLTGEELACVGTYEVEFVDWCNRSQFDFDWQIPHKMPCGRTYIVDAFIKTGKFAYTWVEIKGYMTCIGKQKWDWFHACHQFNSQLWDKSRLLELGMSVK